MTQNGVGSPAVSCSSKPEHTPSQRECEYKPLLSKGDLDTSLSAIYKKLVDKIQLELHKSINALSQEIATIGGRTDILETKHELSLAHNDLRKDYEMLADNFSFMQAQVEDR